VDRRELPQAHRRQTHSSNPFERLKQESRRRTNVADIFPKTAAIGRLVGVLMLEQNDE